MIDETDLLAAPRRLVDTDAEAQLAGWHADSPHAI
jgi:hypothetical protein